MDGKLEIVKPTYVKAIENLLNELKKYRETEVGYFLNFYFEYKEGKFIHKNKIREEIEKLKNELPHIGGCKKDCAKCFNQYRGSNFTYCYAYHQIRILNKLLEDK